MTKDRSCAEDFEIDMDKFAESGQGTSGERSDRGSCGASDRADSTVWTCTDDGWKDVINGGDSSVVTVALAGMGNVGWHRKEMRMYRGCESPQRDGENGREDNRSRSKRENGWHGRG